MKIGRRWAFPLILSVAGGAGMACAGPQYDQCLMQSLRGARNSSATALINDACNKLYNSGSVFLPRDQRYYACILQNVPGVEAALAAEQIAVACRRQNGL